MDLKLYYTIIILGAALAFCVFGQILRYCTALGDCIISFIRCYCLYDRRLTRSHLDFATDQKHFVNNKAQTDSISINIQPDKNTNSKSVFSQPELVQFPDTPLSVLDSQI